MPLRLFSAAEAIAPVKELRLPSRMGARLCARMGGAARFDASATPAPAPPAMNLRRDSPRALALDAVISSSLGGGAFHGGGVCPCPECRLPRAPAQSRSPRTRARPRRLRA